MKSRLKIFFATLCLTILIVFCINGVVFSADCENPDELTFSIVPAMETMQDLALYQPVLKNPCINDQVKRRSA